MHQNITQMKKLLFIGFLLFTTFLFAQKTCEYSTDVKDSIGTYKSTKDYLIYDQNFGKRANYIYFSLINTDGTPSLNIQFINKEDGFIKAKCFDKNSKVYFELNNGKIITLIHIEKDDCGTMLTDNNKLQTRVLTGYFMFIKGSFEELKSSPITLMRIKYATDTDDFVFQKSLHSELDGLYYEPENYFINYLHCIE